MNRPQKQTADQTAKTENAKMTYATIEDARKMKDIRQQSQVNPRLRENPVIVMNENEKFIIVTLGFAVANEIQILK